MRLNMNSENLSHLRFADDIILFADNPKILEIMLQQLADESDKAGLSVNKNKINGFVVVLKFCTNEVYKK